MVIFMGWLFLLMQRMPESLCPWLIGFTDPVVRICGVLGLNHFSHLEAASSLGNPC